MPRDKLFIIAVCLTLLLKSFASIAQVRLPQLIADKMVLQRDTSTRIWGWAAPWEKISVAFGGKKYKAVAASDGTWQVLLSPVKAGGPYTMDIRASNHIILSDILVGDVWFCSGQSNMVIPMERVKEKYPEDIAQADFPQIRNFFVPTASDVSKIHDDLPPGKWIEATPTNVLGFGAASYFFANQLYRRYHVPIGIINSSVGGAPIQAWISAEGLKDIPTYTNRIAQLKDTAYLHRLTPPSLAPPETPTITRPDRGLTDSVKWYEVNYIPEGWHQFWLPGFWADQGVRGLNGVVWFRKEIDIPASMAGKPAKLFVGRIIDADETYVNGVKVGNITYQYPPRRYVIPAGLLRAGKNLLVVRVTNTAGKGGFAPDKRYELTDGITHIDIRGDWQYRVGQVFPPRNFGEGGGGPPPFSAQDEPTGLYNTLVAPAIKAVIKGFVWYQGEANTGKPREYRQLLPALIRDWRTKWRQGDLPFLYVQLPNFMEVQYSPSESQWAELRESQLTALSVPRTAMVVAIDAGEWNDIHPLDKKDVGERLALAARKTAYGEHGLVSSGPIYQSASIEGNKIVLSFTNTGSGLLVKGGSELHQFAIAGADKKFVWADARIDGDKVIVSSNEVPNPLYVRYAWADNPEDANLYNKEGLPASPFTTDERP
jgi:sialate O-acetylesterase